MGSLPGRHDSREEMPESTNLAGRAGRWSAEHWRKALFGWLVFAVAAMVLGNVIGHVQMKDSEVASGEAATALRMLEQAGLTQPATENVLVQSKPLRHASSPGVPSPNGGGARAGTRTAARRHEPAEPDVRSRTAAVTSRATATRCSSSSTCAATPRRRRTGSRRSWRRSRARRRRTRVSIREVGNASANYEIGKTFNKDFANAERMTVPMTLIILLAAFGALVAAGLPVLLAFSAVLASLGLYSLVTPRVRGRLPVDLGRHPPHRHGGRRRLLALLPPARARGACSRQRAATRAAARGVDVRTGRTHLRRDRADRDGRAVHRRQPHLHRHGDRDDARRPLRRDRIGDGAAGDARELGDRVDRGRIPLVGRTKHAAGESRFWGLRPRPRPPAPGALARPRRRASRRGRDAASSACTRSCRASPTCRASCRSCRRTRPRSRPSRARRRRPRSSCRRRTCETPPVRRRSASSEQAAAATGQMFRAVHGHGEPRPHRRADRHRRSPATATTRRRSPRCTRSATR